MKLIISGSRNLVSLEVKTFVTERLTEYNDANAVSELVSGLAIGPDTIGKNWAILNKIKVVEFKPDWKKNKRSAGMIRNMEMAKYGDFAMIFWDGESRGTANMIDCMEKLNKPYTVYRISNNLETK